MLSKHGDANAAAIHHYIIEVLQGWLADITLLHLV